MTSFIIVKELKRLAKAEGKTVIMTIHQPNADIFALFDRLLLMAEGRLIYQGPSADATKYFADNFDLQCPEFYNPADYLISVMHPENPENLARYYLYF